MKTLFLLRHAESIRKMDEPDFDRSLTENGILQAKEVGKILNDNISIKLDFIQSSDAVRTRQTLEILQQEINYTPEIKFVHQLYNASDSTLIEALENADDKYENMMIIGHNPAITSVVCKLNLDVSEEEYTKLMNFDIAAKLVVISSDTKEWHNFARGKNELEYCIYPSSKAKC
jgi:phosphohistidine phosphatase